MADALWIFAGLITGSGVCLAGYWAGLLRGRRESLRLAKRSDEEFRATMLAQVKACTCGAALPASPAPGFAARRKGGRRDA